MQRENRKLAAIVALDVAGFSALIGEDEEGTLRALRGHRRELIEPLIADHGGRIANTAGDSLLLEFASAVDAVRCAIAVQDGMAERNLQIAEGRRLRFRIGINVGDVVVQGDDLLGDGVNVAARLEGLAEPDGLLISQTVHEHVAGKLEARFHDNGEQALKNIAVPVRAWSWPDPLSGAKVQGPGGRGEKKPLVLVSAFEGRRDEEKALAEDLCDDLRIALSRLTGLDVTVDRDKADYLIRGGVRQAGRRCRISVQLINTATDKQLWAERYDEETDDPFEVMDRCVHRIAMSARRRIAADDADGLTGRDMDELSLEELLSLSGVSFFTPTKAGWQKGAAIAERALEREPGNFMALAMAAAGGGLAEFYFGFREPDETVVETAMRQIEEGRRQSNESDMLLAVYSGLLLYGRRRHGEAAAAAERSLRLNPEFNQGLWVLGAAQVFSGDYDKGAATAARAVNVDIRDPYVHLYSRIAGYGHFAAGRFGEAADWFREADQLAPGLPHNLAGLAASQWFNEDCEAARETIARLLAEEPDFHIGGMLKLPFRDSQAGEKLLAGLRSAGAPG